MKCLLYVFALRIYYNLASEKKQAADKTKKRKQEHCLHCGKCKEICPLQAVERRTL
ncbi:MAG: 4Fe-4S binding protein [Lachnospiraceae bacterium]|nr:4Fe-4S binding protein [Lachnospiraceae bacterium]